MPSTSSRKGRENGRQKRNRNRKDLLFLTDEEEQEDIASPIRDEGRRYISREERLSVSRDNLTNLQDTFRPTLQKLYKVKSHMMHSAKMMDNLIEHIKTSFEGSLHIVR